MGSAAAKMRFELGAYSVFGCIRLAIEKRLGPHHHARDAITALRGLLRDEGALHLTRLLQSPQALQRYDLAICASITGVMQEKIASPSTITVHAPH